MIAAVTWIIGISLDKGEFLIRDALLMLFLYALFSIIFEIFETIITKKNNEEITEKTNIQFSNATEKEKNSLDSKKTTEDDDVDDDNYVDNYMDDEDYYSKKTEKTNVKFSDSISGNPNLYYKDIRNFGKLDKIDDNLITDRLNYDVLDPNNDIDYTKPQIKSDGSVPITLSYINYNFKENVIISDTRDSSCI